MLSNRGVRGNLFPVDHEVDELARPEVHLFLLWLECYLQYGPLPVNAGHTGGDGNTAPATCIYCNGCFGPGLKGEGVHCIFDGQ